MTAIAAAAPAASVHDRAPGASRSPIGRIAVHAIVVAFMVIWFTPILGLLINSLRPPAEISSSGWWTVFVEPLLTGFNYQQAMSISRVDESILTSLAIAVPTTIITTLLSAIGAFAFTRMPFRGQVFLSLVLVALLVVPPQVTLVPILRVYSAAGLQGMVPAVWLYQVGFTIPFGIFLLRGFFASIPGDIFEAAEIDGAGTLKMFTTIALPLAGPVLAALAIMSFLWSWNDLLIPLLFLGGSDLSQPITVQVAGMVQTTGQGENLLMASTFVSVLLPLAILIGLQRYFVRGVLGGAVKG
jgi:alpha-glucoside transport system permease protein